MSQDKLKLILASSSPRRKKLLQRLNYPFEIISPNVDESTVSTNCNPEEYCKTLAIMKAEDIGKDHPNSIVIGADTIVVINNQILGKPQNKDHAQYMLETLSGKTHQVITGICLKLKINNINHAFIQKTLVTFNVLSNSDIKYYINSSSPYDKAGSYGIQDWSTVFVKQIRGCYENVVGLPVSKVYQELKKLRINLLDTIS